jgi:hypothetical protein
VLEWQAIGLCGALGGLLTSLFLRAGADVPFPVGLSDYLDSHPVAAFLLNVLRSTVLGGVASLLIWGLYNPNAQVTSGMFTPPQLATALIAGGAGVSVVNNFFRQVEQQQTIQQQADTILELTDAVEEADIEQEDRPAGTPPSP